MLSAAIDTDMLFITGIKYQQSTVLLLTQQSSNLILMHENEAQINYIFEFNIHKQKR